MNLKYLLSTILLLFITNIANSQDLMITNNGDVIKAYNIEIAGNAIFYKLSTNENDAIQRISKSDLLMIKREDGTVTSFSDQPSPNQVPTPTISQSQPPTVRREPLVDRAVNDNIINRINKEVTFSGAPESTDENLRYFFQYFADENSVFEDENIRISLQVSNVNSLQFAFWVTNKSQDIIRIDLSNSYYTIGNNTIVMRENKGTMVVSTSSSKGTSVNLGGIARAAGVGGTAGALANAVNVGGSTTKGISQYIEDDTYIVTIMPSASKYLTDWDVKNQINDNSYNDRLPDVTASDGWNESIKEIGDVLDVKDGEQSHLNIASFITYYKGNDLQNPNTIRSTLKLGKVMGINISTKDLSQGWSNSLFFVKKPLYPPFTEKLNQVALYITYMSPIGAGDGSSSDNHHENIVGYGLSYGKIYNKYKHRYDPDATQYGFGVDIGKTSAKYSYYESRKITIGSYTSYNSSSHYSNVDAINIRLRGSIGMKRNWLTMSISANLGYDSISYSKQDDDYCTDYSGIGGGLNVFYDFDINKKWFVKWNMAGIQFSQIMSYNVGTGIYIGYQF